MNTASHTVAINLIPMAQSRLSNALTTLNLKDQPMGVGNEIIINITNMARHHGTEKETPKTRGWIGRQHQMPKRHSSRRR
jgi:hypothetical protein